MKPLVTNAADTEQVKDAKVTEKTRRRRELEDIRVVLATPNGRRVLWRLMERWKIFGSVYDAGDRIYYNAGQQDAGHFVLAEIIEAQPDAFALMMQESSTETR